MPRKLEFCNEENARLFMRTRNEAKLSQEMLALELGVSKRTIQNWEKGKTSPTVEQMIRYLKILNIQPLPFILEYLYPTIEGIDPSDSDEKIRDALLLLVKTMPERTIRELMYLFYGSHGSSPTAIMEMITAHLQSPMRDRYTTGMLVLQNYEIAKLRNELTDQSHIQPDTVLLQNAIKKGQDAVTNNKNAYILDPKKVIK